MLNSLYPLSFSVFWIFPERHQKNLIFLERKLHRNRHNSISNQSFNTIYRSVKTTMSPSSYLFDRNNIKSIFTNFCYESQTISSFYLFCCKTNICGVNWFQTYDHGVNLSHIGEYRKWKIWNRYPDIQG